MDPAAIEEVQRESWPVVRDPDELHDALLTLLWLPVEEVQDWAIHLPRLIEEGRAVELNVRGEGLGVRGEAQEVRGWVATEHQAQVETVFAGGDDTTLDAIVLGWMESIGPITSLELAARLHLPSDSIHSSLASPRSIRPTPPRTISDLTQPSALSLQNCRALERPSGATAGCWRAFIG